MSSVSSKNVINKMGLQIIYIWYKYKQDLTLDILQWLIWYKTHQTKAYTFNIQWRPKLRD